MIDLDFSKQRMQKPFNLVCCGDNIIAMDGEIFRVTWLTTQHYGMRRARAFLITKLCIAHDIIFSLSLFYETKPEKNPMQSILIKRAACETIDCDSK